MLCCRDFATLAAEDPNDPSSRPFIPDEVDAVQSKPRTLGNPIRIRQTLAIVFSFRACHIRGRPRQWRGFCRSSYCSIRISSDPMSFERCRYSEQKNQLACPLRGKSPVARGRLAIQA